MQDVDAVHASDEQHHDRDDGDLIRSDGEGNRGAVVRRPRSGVEKLPERRARKLAPTEPFRYFYGGDRRRGAAGVGVHCERERGVRAGGRERRRLRRARGGGGGGVARRLKRRGLALRLGAPREEAQGDRLRRERRGDKGGVDALDAEVRRPRVAERERDGERAAEADGDERRAVRDERGQEDPPLHAVAASPFSHDDGVAEAQRCDGPSARHGPQSSAVRRGAADAAQRAARDLRAHFALRVAHRVRVVAANRGDDPDPPRIRCERERERDDRPQQERQRE